MAQMIPHANYRLAKEFGVDYGDVLKLADDLVHYRIAPDNFGVACRLAFQMDQATHGRLVARVIEDNRQDLRK